MPTDIFINIFEDNIIPVIAPNGDSKRESPKLPSEKPSLALIPGIDPTQIPKSRLVTAYKKPTENNGRLFKKEIKFLNIIQLDAILQLKKI